jgi:hypothetical protein
LNSKYFFEKLLLFKTNFITKESKEPLLTELKNYFFLLKEFKNFIIIKNLFIVIAGTKIDKTKKLEIMVIMDSLKFYLLLLNLNYC